MPRFVLICCLMLLTFPAFAQTMSIATGSPSGTYYPFGGGLASLWSKHISGFNMKAEVTGGSVTNVAQVARGESEAAITQADVALDAVRGSGKFPDPLPVVALHNLYPNLMHIVTQADSDVHALEDIKGKVISVGAPGSGNASATWKILRALDFTADDVDVRNLNYGDTAAALKDGHIDVGFISGSQGLAAMIELALTREIRLIPLSDAQLATLQEKAPAFRPYQLPGGIYQGVEEPVQLASLWNLLMVHKDLPEETAYQMVKTTFANQKRLREVSSVARFLTLENATELGAIPMHPGAERYFLEAQMRRAE